MLKQWFLVIIVSLVMIMLIGCSESSGPGITINNMHYNFIPEPSGDQKLFYKNEVVYMFSSVSGSMVAMTRQSLQDGTGIFVTIRNASKEWIDFEPKDIIISLESVSGDKKVYPILNGNEYLSQLKNDNTNASNLSYVFNAAAKGLSGGLLSVPVSEGQNYSPLETTMLKKNTIFPDKDINGWFAITHTGVPAFIPDFLKVVIPVGKTTHTFVLRVKKST